MIYHFGIAKVNWMAGVRVLAITVLSFVTIIAMPAYYLHGSPWWALALGQSLPHSMNIRTQPYHYHD